MNLQFYGAAGEVTGSCHILTVQGRTLLLDCGLIQAVGTLGRALVDRRERVRIHGETYQVAARVHTLGGLSAHGDQQDLLRWHAGLSGARRTWLVHGEDVGATGIRDALRAKGVAAEVARSGQRIELGRGTA